MGNKCKHPTETIQRGKVVSFSINFIMGIQKRRWGEDVHVELCISHMKCDHIRNKKINNQRKQRTG